MEYNTTTDGPWYVYGELFGFERNGKFYIKDEEYSKEEFYSLLEQQANDIQNKISKN